MTNREPWLQATQGKSKQCSFAYTTDIIIIQSWLKTLQSIPLCGISGCPTNEQGTPCGLQLRYLEFRNLSYGTNLQSWTWMLQTMLCNITKKRVTMYYSIGIVHNIKNYSELYHSEQYCANTLTQRTWMIPTYNAVICLKPGPVLCCLLSFTHLYRKYIKHDWQMSLGTRCSQTQTLIRCKIHMLIRHPQNIYLYKSVTVVALTLFCHWATCHSFSQWPAQQPRGSQSAQSRNPLSHFHHKPPWKGEIWARQKHNPKNHAFEKHRHTISFNLVQSLVMQSSGLYVKHSHTETEADKMNAAPPTLQERMFPNAEKVS